MTTNLFGQVDFLQAYQDSLDQIDFVSYEAILRRKKMGSDVFSPKEKRFKVFARRNKRNLGYGFDWELQGSKIRVMFIEDDFYGISERSHTIWQSEGVIKLEGGIEFKRSLILPDEMIFGLDSFSQAITKVELDDGYWRVELVKGTGTIVRCFIDESTLFMKKWEQIDRESELGLEQVLEVVFSNVQKKVVFSDSILNPNYYLSHGYQLKDRKVGKAKKNDKDEKQPINMDSLLARVIYSADGDSITIDEIEAKIYLVDFWYLSCLPCLKALPHLQDLSDKYRAMGLKVIGVNCFDDKMKTVAIEKLRKQGILYSNYFSDRHFYKTVGIQSFPTILVLNSKKELIYVGEGYSSDAEDVIKKELGLLEE